MIRSAAQLPWGSLVGVKVPVQRVWRAAAATRNVAVATRAALKPQKVCVEPGTTAALCCCHKSSKLPFCDGTHRKHNAEHGTSFKPQVLKNKGANATNYYACTCGQSGKFPLCDGTHRKLPQADEAEA